ncbi:MAG: DUF3038 domain-containing protein, partial [Crinalium sp.]|uniref:DUF3038 domain-containing protein n=1 Tax=Crinalium epipsammum PCC 9333 TaxID=1173022 RepID=K9W272_9CYAN|nr:DUF3038 domain-containing protein [Crinalium epipsammum]AFZ13899.1 hypothetical protein Cri9333_3060 [Crinalium epipsammum PCC 9333]
MIFSVSVMPLNSPTAQPKPMILDNLPSPPISSNVMPRRAKVQIDLILLAIEALELGGSEVMLAMVQDLQLQEIIKNRVVLWRLRSTNPLRKAHSRRNLTLDEAKALVVVACYIARRLTVVLRQFLLEYQQLNEKQLPVENNFRLSEYLERFRAHFRSRMNPRRTTVSDYRSDEKLNALAMSLLSQLLFCTGTSGMQRFWISLFDGEVE